MLEPVVVVKQMAGDLHIERSHFDSSLEFLEVSVAMNFLRPENVHLVHPCWNYDRTSCLHESVLVDPAKIIITSNLIHPLMSISCN